MRRLHPPELHLETPVTTPDTLGGKAVLTLGHVAGMIDMVALPLWIGALMQHYRYSPAQAGLTVTLFLLGVVVASAFFAPRFNRTPRRAATACGFAVASVAFYMVGQQSVAVASFHTLWVLHLVAGLGVGCALTFTHGCIGRSANPHRLFGVVNAALGGLAVVFMAVVPNLLEATQPTLLFQLFAALMGAAALVVALAFPGGMQPGSGGVAAAVASAPLARIPSAAWFIIAVVMCLTLNQSMVFSFVERIGAERGFGLDRVHGVLIALGLVNLSPGLLAALLQHRLSPLTVGLAGPVGQAVLALTLSSTLVFAPYAVAAALYVFMVIFTHNFLFGLLSRLDLSGRAAAATPAMMMVGSCLGPALGGVLVQGFGYPALGYAASVVALVAVISMWQVRRRLHPAGLLPSAQPESAALAPQGGPPEPALQPTHEGKAWAST